MKVKGLNKLYDVEVKKMKMDDGRKGISVTAGNIMTGMTSVVISEEDWKGFILRKYDKAKEFRDSIRERDNFQCLLCGKISKSNHVHHINYDNNHLFEETLTLCNSCHSKTNFNRKYWINYLKTLLSKLYLYNYERGVEV